MCPLKRLEYQDLISDQTLSQWEEVRSQLSHRLFPPTSSAERLVDELPPEQSYREVDPFLLHEELAQFQLALERNTNER